MEMRKKDLQKMHEEISWYDKYILYPDPSDRFIGQISSNAALSICTFSQISIIH